MSSLASAKPLRVLGYARISRLREDDASTSVERQHHIISQECASRGLELVDIVDDIDVSASKARLDRPGLNELRARIAAGEADAVMVWRLDRIARSVVDFGLLLEGGLKIISASEPLNTADPMGRAMAEVLQVFAKLESSTTALRTKGSVAHLRKVGRYAGGPVPYGYRTAPHPSGAGRALEPDPVEVPHVRRMVDAILAGRTAHALAIELNADGIETSRRGPWRDTTLRRILVGDTLLGRVTVNGALLRGEDGLPVVAWEPLVTIEEAERLRAILASKTPSNPQRRRATRLLSGLCRCGSCGARLLVHWRSNGVRDAITYSCGASRDGAICPKAVAVTADLLDAEVEARFLEAFGIFTVVRDEVIAPEPVALVEVEQAIRDTTAEMGAERADVEALIVRLRTLRKARDEINDRPIVEQRRMVDTKVTFGQTWAAADVDGKRELLKGVGLTVTVDPSPNPNGGRSGGRSWVPERVTVLAHGVAIPARG